MWRRGPRNTQIFSIKILGITLFLCTLIASAQDDVIAVGGKVTSTQFPFLSISTIKPINQTYEQPTVQPTVVAITQTSQAEYIEDRFTGLLSHVRWLLNQQETEVVDDSLLRKQIFSFMDDVSDDFSDIRDEFSTDELTVGGDANVDGSLVVGGSLVADSLSINSLASNGAVTAPYFTATSSIDISTFPNLIGTNATTTNATTTNLFGSTARFTTSIIADLTATLVDITTATIATLTGTDLTFTNATTTNATSTNLFSTNASATNLDATNATSSGLAVTGSLTVPGSIDSHFIPGINDRYDLGSPAFFWQDAYIDDITVNNISAASTTIAGSNSATFTINADNASADTEDATLIFYRGSAAPNALLTWDSTDKRFEFNFPVFSADGIFTNATSTDLYATTFGLGGSYFTSLLGNGLVNDGGSLAVSTSSLATEFYQQNGNTFGTLATLGTNDSNALTFETNNARRVTIDAAGNVGIGDTSPASLLTVGNGDLFQVNSSGQVVAGTWQGAIIGDAYLTKTGNWTGIFDGQEGSYYLSRANHTGTQTLATISDAGALAALNDLSTFETDDLSEGVSNLYFTNARARNALSETITGIDYASSTGSFSLTSGYVIPLSASTTEWATAYSWGDHAVQNYFDKDTDDTDDLTEGTTNLFSQWSTSGADIYYTTGNVGIGTTTPSARLALQTTGTTNILDLYETGGNQVFTILENGQVGIGVTPTSEQLEIYGINNHIKLIDSVLPSYPAKLTYSYSDGLSLIARDGLSTSEELVIGKGFMYDGTNSVIGTASSGDVKFYFDSAGNPEFQLYSGSTLFLEAFAGNQQKLSIGAGVDTSNAAKLQVTGDGYFSGNVGIGTTTPSYKLTVGSTDGSDAVGIYHDSTSGYINWSDGQLNLQTLEPNINGTVAISGNGTGYGTLIVNNAGATSNFSIQAIGADAYLGSSAGRTRLQHSATGDVWLFTGSGSGTTRELAVYGFRSGDALRSLQIGVGVDAADTASFDGVSNYYFDGNVGIGDTTPASLLTVGTGDAFQVNNSGEASITYSASALDGLNLNLTRTGTTGDFSTGIYNSITDNTNFTTFNETYGLYNYINKNNNASAGSNLYGTYNSVYNSGGSATNNTYGSYATVSGDTDGVSTNYAYYADAGGADNNYLFYGDTPAAASTNLYGLYLDVSGGAGTAYGAAILGGDVGIGTTTPGFPLHTYKATGANVTKIETDSGSASLVLDGYQSVDATVGSIAFSNAGDSLAVIGSSRDGADDAGNLTFFTQPTLGAAVERMRITSTGNVGIGTTSPSQKLHVKHTGTGVAFFDHTGGTNAAVTIGDNTTIANDTGLYFRTTGVGSIQTAAGGSLQFREANGDVNMYIDGATGNVGIGTTTPARKFVVSSTGQGVMQVDSTAGGSSVALFSNSGVDRGYVGYINQGTTGMGFLNSAGSVANLLVTDSGNVGIGTTSPSSLLHVRKDQNAATALRIENISDLSSAVASLVLAGSQGNSLVLQTNSTTALTPDTNRSVISAPSNVAGMNLKAESTIGTLQFYTGGAAAANERMRISSTGNVGIGTNSPSTRLHVESSNSGTAIGGSEIFSLIKNSNTTTGALSGIGFTVNNSTNVGAKILASNLASNGGANLLFTTRNSSGVEGERMRIDSNGNVGIGTTAPGNTLTVAKDYVGSIPTSQSLNSNVQTHLINASDSATFSALAFETRTTDRSLGMMGLEWTGASTGDFFFRLRDGSLTSKEVLRLTSSGNVGIGTTTPAAKLQVDGDIALGTPGGPARSLLAYDSSAGAYTQLIYWTGANGILGRNTPGGSVDNWYIRTGGTDRMTINSAGNVGIGTTTPVSKLHVYSGASGGTVSADVAIETSGDAVIGLLGSNTAKQTIRFADTNDNNIGGIQYDHANDTMSFKVNDLAAATFLSSGNLGIGITTAAQKLQVFGNIRVGTSGSNGCLEDFGGGLIAGTCSSDAELKTDITPVATGESFMARFMELNVVTYKWNQTANSIYSKNTTIDNLGLIAQNVESVFPELISYDDEGYRQVDFRAFPFYMIEALKEIWDKVSGNSEKIEELEERIRQLEQKQGVSSPTLNPDPAPQPEEPVVEEEPAPEPEVVAETPTEEPAEEEVVEPVLEPEPEPTPEPEPASTPEPEPPADPTSSTN